MKGKDKASALFWAGTMLALILDSQTSLKGCREGVELCIRSVIPALFPFLMLSPILISVLRFKLPGFLHRLLKMPQGADALIITGCLGGYPVGAQCIAEAARRGQLSKPDANRMMAFCCNCGPGFIFGICNGFFEAKWVPWVLWLCHIGGAFMIGALIPGKQSSAKLKPDKEVSVMDAFSKAIKAMAQICGWVVLFRCMLEFLQRWVLWRLDVSFQVIITGMLELTNGCFALPALQNEGLRFVICEAMLSFGGLCVAMQTASVTEKVGLGLYLPGKLGQMVISTLLACGLWMLIHGNWQYTLWIGAALAGLLSAVKLFFRKRENIGGNLRPAGV
ncbi:MAG: hypothetical protein ACI3W5_13825 [Faecousia sp.]